MLSEVANYERRRTKPLGSNLDQINAALRETHWPAPLRSSERKRSLESLRVRCRHSRIGNLRYVAEIERCREKARIWRGYRFERSDINIPNDPPVSSLIVIEIVQDSEGAAAKTAHPNASLTPIYRRTARKQGN